MIGNIGEFYNTHKDHDVIFNKNVIRYLGLKPDQVSFKCGNLNIPCILFSTSLHKSRIIAKLDESIFRALSNNGNIINLKFTFYLARLKQTLSFHIDSKIIEYDTYDSKKADLYFIVVIFNKIPPRDFIEILGEHIIEQEGDHIRAVERVVIENNKSLESFIFMDGNGKKCILTEISLFSAKILVTAKLNDFKVKSPTMLIMKSTKLQGLGEMIGYIERVEEINSAEGILSVIITFDQEKIPPAYKLWVSECIEIAKLRS